MSGDLRIVMLQAGVIAIRESRAMPREVHQVLGNLTLLDLAQLGQDHEVGEDDIAALHLLLVGTNARWQMRRGQRRVTLCVDLVIDRSVVEPIQAIDEMFLIGEAQRVVEGGS